ncbi:hypothetical protein LINPERPRIM_LOCUS827 [Linum perenne]
MVDDDAGKSPPPSRSSACENLLRIWATTRSANLLRSRGRLLERISSGFGRQRGRQISTAVEVVCLGEPPPTITRSSAMTRSSAITTGIHKSFVESEKQNRAGRSKPVIDSSKALPPQATFRGPYVNTGSCDIGPNFQSYPKK